MLHYTQTNPDADPPHLVLVHGAGGCIQNWPSQWTNTGFFAKSRGKRRWLTDFSVTVMDLPGHGRSGGEAQTTIEGNAQAVIDLIETLGLKKVVVAGHSMGGAIAQTIGLEKPSWLSGLILIGTGAKMPVSDMILDGLISDFEKTVAMITKFSWRKQASTNFTKTAIQHMTEAGSQVTHTDFMACNQFDVTDRLSEISVPALVLGGPEDKMMPLPMSEFLAENIPSASLKTIPNTGHFLMIEQTGAVSKEVVTFLNSL